jgi:hypothetical protein
VALLLPVAASLVKLLCVRYLYSDDYDALEPEKRAYWTAGIYVSTMLPWAAGCLVLSAVLLWLAARNRRGDADTNHLEDYSGPDPAPRPKGS